MRHAGRLLVAAVGLVISGGVFVPPAAAEGTWTVDTSSPVSGSAGVSITGGASYGNGSGAYDFQIDIVSLYIHPSDGLPEGCESPDASYEYPDSPHPGQDNEGIVLTAAAPTCNGIHTVEIGASGTWWFVLGGSGQDTYWEDLATVVVSNPPPPVEGLTAKPEGRAVALSWSPPNGYAENPPPDFLGYRVRRIVGDGSAETVAGGEAPLQETTFTDGGLPDQGGTVRYQVSAVRRGGDGEPLVSPAANSAPIPFTAAGTPAPGVIAPPPTAPNPPRPRTAPLPPPVQTTQTIGAADPLDETLDFGDEAEPGDEAPVLPDDEFATGAVVRNFDDDDPAVDRALLLPVAAGLCLLGWSLHLRYLTRQALATTAETVVVEALEPPTPGP